MGKGSQNKAGLHEGGGWGLECQLKGTLILPHEELESFRFEDENKHEDYI